MSKPRGAGRFLALIAAYVVALQALLLPLAVAASGIADFGLCSGASAVSTQSPAGDQSGCPCVAGCGMPCCGQVLAEPPKFIVTAELSPVGSNLSVPALASPVRPAMRQAQSARGPPGS